MSDVLKKFYEMKGGRNFDKPKGIHLVPSPAAPPNKSRKKKEQ